MNQALKIKLSTLFPFLLQLFLVSLSLVLVGLAQPDWSPFCCILAAASGYALFWYGMGMCRGKLKRFFLAGVWFAGVQALHLSWFASDRYVGSFIFVFLAILLICLGICFGLFSLLIPPSDRLSLLRICSLAGGWTLFEWGRLFLLSGFSWDPIGFALTGSIVSMQMASAFGMFGLTFWVVFTNLFALKVFSKKHRIFQSSLWVLIATVPYLFGWQEISFHRQLQAQTHYPSLNVLLVQTSLYPEQKVVFQGEEHLSLSPIDQWRLILSLLKPKLGHPVDLIAFSEAVVPYGTDVPLFYFREVAEAFRDIFQIQLQNEEGPNAVVGNAFWAQALSNVFQADIVIGLEDIQEREDGYFTAYNAAFLFQPGGGDRRRYEKRVLVPFGEYIPFEWCKKILVRYGILDSFTPGKEAKVFPGKKASIGMSICYEETYGHLMRENRLRGASILVNLTNDVWYPKSRLPIVHYLHGRVRAVEGGLPVVRASNTGVTCAIDSLGHTLSMLDYENPKGYSSPGVLYLALPLYTYPTLYSRYGDHIIICFSIFAVLIAIISTVIPLPQILTSKSN